MLHFDCDYMEGAHPLLMQRLMETNLEQTPGYGVDDYCQQAKVKIREACGCPDADVFFLIGGTHTNDTMIDYFLGRYQGVLAAVTGHINVHEAGIIESSGHKVLPLPQYEGKIKAADVEAYVKTFFADPSHEHMVEPGMVYISHPSEYGTIYSLAELTELSEVCHRYHLPLYMDGARLGYALASKQTDVTLQDIARLCDAFYIGGTKVGALFGEAVVFPKGEPKSHFFTFIKQHGALLAKGRLLGLQFDALFTDHLYTTIARHAIDCAERLKEIVHQNGWKFFLETPTNQQFLALDAAQLADLSKIATYDVWEQLPDGRTVIRLATSWATRMEAVEALAR